ncbi:MAG: hypothetical protein ACKVSF_12725 [Alphaproteobacteria bacterium]
MRNLHPLIRLAILAALVAMFAIAGANAPSLAQSAVAPVTVRWADGAFSVKIPNGWQQVAPEDPNARLEIRSAAVRGNCTISTRPAEQPRIEDYDRAWFDARAAAVLRQAVVRSYELKRIGANRGGLGDVVGDLELAGGTKRFRGQMFFLLDRGIRYTISCFDDVASYDAIRPAFTLLTESFAFVK